MYNQLQRVIYAYRKYAERLYAMLRPLQNFEAYFLTDVSTDLATKHMKKYDQLLLQNKQSRW